MIVAVGVNHRTAPLPIRERLAVRPADLSRTIEGIRQVAGVEETVLLSTCNRIEAYAARDGEGTADRLRTALPTLRGVDPAELADRTYLLRGGEAVHHLFAVAAGLDSLAVGEEQILGQVREAYREAESAGSVGAALHPLFQNALRVGRRVRTETGIAAGRVSVPSIAVDLAGRVFEDLAGACVLLLGAGAMGGLTLEYLRKHGVRDILVMSRTRDSAERLAREAGGRALDLDALGDVLPRADIVVGTLDADRPVLTAAGVADAMRRRRHRPMTLIDIALPRNVEPAAGEIDGVYRYDLDDLESLVAETHDRRRESVDTARALVTAEADRFVRETWNAGWVGPILADLHREVDRVRREELARLLRRLEGIDPAAREEIERMTHRIVRKMLHAPAASLREAAENGRGPEVLRAARTLFRLPDDRNGA